MGGGGADRGAVGPTGGPRTTYGAAVACVTRSAEPRNSSSDESEDEHFKVATEFAAKHEAAKERAAARNAAAKTRAAAEANAAAEASLRAIGSAVAGAICGVREVVLEAVQQSGRALALTSVELRGDRGVVPAAVQQSGLALQFASVALRADWGVVLTAVLQDGGELENALEALEAGPEFQVAAREPDIDGTDFAPVEPMADPGVALAVVRRSGLALRFVSRALRGDRSVVLAAVRRTGAALQLAAGKRPKNSDRNLANHLLAQAP